LVLVVPSHYRESNLQLLLGIAKACQLEIKGLLNKAVLALQNELQADGEFWHFDVQLHQTVCSRIRRATGLVSLVEVEILSDVGIYLMQEALLKGLQNNFIRNDRFDPLHDAATEQQLFDQLPNIAMQLADTGKASVGLEHQSRLHNTTLDAKEWQALLAPFSDRLIDVSRSADASYIDFNAAFAHAGLDLLTQAGFIQIHEAVNFCLSEVVIASDSGNIIYRTDLPILKPSAKAIKNDDISKKAIEQSKLAVNRAAADLNDKQTKAKEIASRLSFNADVSLPSVTHLLCGGKATLLANAYITTERGVLGLQQAAQGNVQQLLSSGGLFILNDEGRVELKINDRMGSNLADGVLTVIQVF
jgi:hypothetical protein